MVSRVDGLRQRVEELEAALAECQQRIGLDRIQRDLAIALGVAADPDEGLQLCLRAALTASGMDAGGVYLVDESSGALRLATQQGLSPEFVAGAAEYEPDSPQAELVRAGEPHFAQHLTVGVPVDAPRRREGLRAMGVLPVCHGGEVIGCLNVASHDLDEVPESAREALRAIAAQTGSAIAVLRQRTQARQALQYRLEFEQLIANIATRFINLAPEYIDDGIQQALGEIGEVVGVDRVLLLQYRDQGLRVAASHEWSAPGISSQIEELQDLDAGQYGWPSGYLMDDQPIYVPRVSDLPPEAESFAAVLRASGLRSLVVVPMRVCGELDGCVTFSALRQEVSWSEDVLALLTTVAAMFANAIQRQRTEAKLRATEEQLVQAQKMEAIGALAGGVAHEFNNLLTGIMGCAGVLKLRAEPGSQFFEDADAIEKTARRAFQLTDQLLGFARKGKVRHEAVDVHRIVRDVAAVLERTLDERIELVTRLDAQTTVVMGDPGQLQQVLLNLAINARDAMPEGGKLTFRTTEVELGEDEFARSCRLPPGPYLLVEVSDTGVGIAHNIRDRIFEPFFTTKEPGRGTGMGLAVAYGIVEGHGGAIDVESAANQGAEFRLHLPRAQAKADGRPRTEPPMPAERTRRILIVDDEQAIRFGAERMLTALGYEVVTARDGREAVAYFADHREEIDLALVDMTMPVMNGAQCFTRLRKLDPEIPVVISTGYALEQETEQLLEAGAVGLLRKPFGMRQLAEMVASALRH